MNALVPDFIVEKAALGQLQGSLTGSALFVDISGFTALTETLTRHGRAGAEVLAETLRWTFDPLVDAVLAAGGFIPNFAGDAFTALFPQDEHPDAALLALGAAQQMRRFFLEHELHSTIFGDFAFSIKIGLAFGLVHWSIVPASGERSYFYFHGPAIDACAEAEHHAGKNEIRLADAYPGPSLPEENGPSARILGPRPMGERLEADARRFLIEGMEAIAPEGEFRSIASVFISLEPAADPSEILRRLHDLSRSRGGTLQGLDFGDKGCKALVYFGSPVAHEDDLERALDFALELRGHLPAPTRMRAGVTFGLQYAGFNGGTRRHDFTCLGRATNLAARLMMKAAWGELWCSPVVHARVEDLYTWKLQGEHLFKGIAEPVLVHSALDKLGSARRSFGSTMMVGRDRELGELLEGLSPIFSGAYAGVLYIEGEPGMGKSLLVEALRGRLLRERGPDAFLWLVIPSEKLSARAWSPFIHALRERFGGEREPFEAQLERLIEGLGPEQEPLRHELGRVRSFLAALVGLRSTGTLYERLDSKLRYDNTLMALRSWLQAESSLRPVVLHLEDAQWLDPESIDAIEHLARFASGWRLAIVCTCRSRDDGTAWRLTLPAEALSRGLALSALDEGAIQSLAGIQLSGTASVELVELLKLKAQGNPFFAEQILSHLREQRQLVPTPQGWSPAAGASALPDDLNSLLIARLDRLSLEVKRVVQAGAVLGMEVPLLILSAMLRSDPGLSKKARGAEEQQIWSALDELRYLFRHALLRDAAYEMQAQIRLRELHRLAAEALETFHAQALGAHHAELGEHWKNAQEPEKARPYFLAAARQAKDAYALKQAEAMYRAYLRLTPEPLPESVEARIELGRWILKDSGRLELAQVELEGALEEARALGDWRLQGQGLRALADIHSTRGQGHRAIELLTQALEMLRQACDRRGESQALKILANVHLDQGRVQQAITLYEQSLAICRETSDRQGEGQTLANLAIVYYEQGQMEPSLALQEQALAISREIGNQALEGVALGNIALARKEQGRIPEAMAAYGQALILFRKVGARAFEGNVLGNLAIIHKQQGRFQQALDTYEQALAILREAGNRRMEGTTLGNLAAVHEAQGQLDRALALYEQALAIFREIGALRSEGIALGSLTDIYLEQGRPEQALAVNAQALDLMQRVGDRWFETVVLWKRLRTRRWCMDAPDVLAQGFQEIEARLGEGGSNQELALCLCDQGHLALERGASAEPILDRAERIARSLAVESSSELSKSISRLRRAVAAFEAGEHARLFRGQLIEDLPEGLRRWLVERGHLF